MDEGGGEREIRRVLRMSSTSSIPEGRSAGRFSQEKSQSEGKDETTVKKKGRPLKLKELKLGGGPENSMARTDLRVDLDMPW